MSDQQNSNSDDFIVISMSGYIHIHVKYMYLWIDINRLCHNYLLSKILFLLRLINFIKCVEH